MGKKDQQTTRFQQEGRFLGFVVKDGCKLKRLRLLTAKGECSIKLTKESRASIGLAGEGALLPGDWVQVWGQQSSRKGEITLKADGIQRQGTVSPTSATRPSVPPPCPLQADTPRPQPATQALPATILMCQKSDCMKRGGKALCGALQLALDDRGLADQVTVRGTGCMKRCKAGPNLIMPDKTRCTRIAPHEVPALIDQHFPAQSPLAEQGYPTPDLALPCLVAME